MYKNKLKNRSQRKKHNKHCAKKLSTNQRNQNNSTEIAFKYILFDLGLKYIWQKPFYTSERYVCVDFYLPEFNIVIEIDGSYHKKKKDDNRTLYLKRQHKIKEVIRFKNHEVRKHRMDVITALLQQLYCKVI